MNKNTDRYQQGDVNIFPIEKLPEGLIEQKDTVLQEGEVTGHKHQFTADSDVTVLYMPDSVLLGTEESKTIHPGITKFLQVNKPSKLVHEEHKTIIIQPGLYKTDLVREFNYDLMETRRVVD